MRAPTILVRDLCTHTVIAVPADESLVQCAQLMREHHVGSLIVLEASGGHERAAGILTDRDIVIGPAAAGLDLAALKASEVMTSPLMTVRDDDDILDALAQMRAQGARRLAVTDARKQLVGVVSLDDLFQAVASQIDDLVKVVKAEQCNEATQRTGTRAPYETGRVFGLGKTAQTK